jgi:protein involved in polysaccharide export with SLBB domain
MVCAVMVCAAVLTSGCTSMKSIWNGLMDPSQVGHFGTAPQPGEIRRTLTIHDEPLGVPGATEPLPEDSVAVTEAYQIGPGDILQISIFALLNPEQESVQQVQISELGNIHLRVLGWIEGVSGLTVRQLQETIVQRLNAEDILAEPLVEVTLLSRRQRTFSIDGMVQGVGTYEIIKTDFRLIEALIMAGSVPENYKDAYIYREMSAASESAKADDGDTDSASNDPPPDTEPSPTPAAHDAETDTHVEEAEKAEPSEAAEELLEAARPDDPGPTPRFDGQAWRDVETTQPTDRAGDVDGETTPDEDSVDWVALAEEGRQRIIHVPLDRLRHGEQRYNIVIQNDDLIWVPAGQIGEFFLMGHVQRPGAYTLTGREVTLKQAIASAGGLSIEAWPTRCEISRRIGEGREVLVPIDLDAIFDGRDQDVLLRPGDIVNVGTSAVSSFLAVIRSAFRVSYGFGFVYDRNFADIDSYGPDVNPTARRRNDLRSRFGI